MLCSALILFSAACTPSIRHWQGSTRDRLDAQHALDLEMRLEIRDLRWLPAGAEYDTRIARVALKIEREASGRQIAEKMKPGADKPATPEGMIIAAAPSR